MFIPLSGPSQPVSPAARENVARLGAGELERVRPRGTEGFQRLPLTPFTEIGFQPERTERGREAVDVYANPMPNRAALSGSRRRGEPQ